MHRTTHLSPTYADAQVVSRGQDHREAAVDTCDASCPAAALVIWWHAGCPGEIHLCGHHADQAAPRLASEGWRVAIDERVIAREA
jgi:coenzyme F420-reducing hydrogenase gamma subunit